MTALIEQILLLTEDELGSVSATQAPLDLASWLRALEARWRPACTVKGVAFSTRLADDASRPLRCDPAMLTRIADALLSNAVKFTHAGAIGVEVAVLPGANEREAVVRATVTDSGVGIDPALWEQSFTPFWQERTGHTRPYGGASLGLTVARTLARAMNGDVRILSSQPGAGSCFGMAVCAHREATRQPESTFKPSCNI